MGRIKHKKDNDSNGSSKKRGETRKRLNRASKLTAINDSSQESKKGSGTTKPKEKKVNKEILTRKKRIRQSKRLSNSSVKKAKKRAFEVYEFSDDSLIDSGLGESIHKPKKGLTSSTPSITGHKTKMSLPKVSPVASASPPLKRIKKTQSPEFHRFTQSEKRKSFSNKQNKEPVKSKKNKGPKRVSKMENKIPIINLSHSDTECNNDVFDQNSLVQLSPEKCSEEISIAKETEEPISTEHINILKSDDENVIKSRKRKRRSYVGLKKKKEKPKYEDFENNSENIFTEDSVENSSKIETDPYSIDNMSEEEKVSSPKKPQKKTMNSKFIQKYKEQEERIIEEINSLDEYELVIE